MPGAPRPAPILGAALLAAGALANTEMVQVDPSLCAPETNELVRQGPWYVGGRH